MNVSEEKNYLYGMMKDITDERRRLSEMYMSLKTRLDQLNTLEEKGVTELSTKGFFDYFNNSDTTIQITNVQREAQATINRELEKEKDIPMPRRYADIDLATKVSEETIQKIADENPAQQVAATTMESIIPQEKIEEMKDKDFKNSKTKPRKQVKKRGTRVITGLSTKEANEMVEEILKERIEPVSNKELYDLVVQKSGHKDITLKNFTGNVLTRIFKMNEHVVRSGTGFSQYKE